MIGQSLTLVLVIFNSVSIVTFCKISSKIGFKGFFFPIIVASLFTLTCYLMMAENKNYFIDMGAILASSLVLGCVMALLKRA